MVTPLRSVAAADDVQGVVGQAFAADKANVRAIPLLPPRGDRAERMVVPGSNIGAAVRVRAAATGREAGPTYERQRCQGSVVTYYDSGLTYQGEAGSPRAGCLTADLIAAT